MTPIDRLSAGPITLASPRQRRQRHIVALTFIAVALLVCGVLIVLVTYAPRAATAQPAPGSEPIPAMHSLPSNRGQQIVLTVRVLNLLGQPTEAQPRDRDEAELLNLFGRAAATRPGQPVRELIGNAQAMKLASITSRAHSYLNATTLTAPRITLFDGQRAYAMVSSSHAYLSGYGMKRMPDGSIAPNAQISNVQAGVIVSAQPFLNANRSAVYMLLEPEISNLVSMQSKQIANPWGADKLQIQVPVIVSFKLDDRVVIPLGQTLIIAGKEEQFQIENGVRKHVDGDADPARKRKTTLMLITPMLVVPATQPATRGAPPAPSS